MSDIAVQVVVDEPSGAEKKTGDEAPAEGAIAVPINIDKLNPFEVIDYCAGRIGDILPNIGKCQNAESEIIEISEALIVACKKDIDATIGAVHIAHRHQYSNLHPIYTAVLSYILCDALAMEQKSSQSIISAALTCNIGMLDFQDGLQQQSSALNDEQKKEVHNHPEKSVAILRACGIEDQEWLDSVRQHHERANGKGYPGGLTGDKTVIGAKIIALADVYSAMISPRSYRKSLEASGALKTVFLERGKEYDETLSILLIKRMGIYPPGSYVRLKNEEIAIVTKRSYDSMKPGVASLVNPNGKNYIKPLYRNTQSPEYGIRGAVEFNGELAIALPLIWGYE